MGAGCQRGRKAMPARGTRPGGAGNPPGSGELRFPGGPWPGCSSRESSQHRGRPTAPCSAGAGGCSAALGALTASPHPEGPGTGARSGPGAASEHEDAEPRLLVSPTFICSRLQPKPSSPRETTTRRRCYRARTSRARRAVARRLRVSPRPDQRSTSKKIRHSLTAQSEISDRRPRLSPARTRLPAQWSLDGQDAPLGLPMGQESSVPTPPSALQRAAAAPPGPRGGGERRGRAG